MEQHIEALNDQEACEIYDKLDGCIIRFNQSLDIDDLIAAWKCLKDRVEPVVDSKVEEIRQSYFVKKAHTKW